MPWNRPARLGQAVAVPHLLNVREPFEEALKAGKELVEHVKRVICFHPTGELREPV